MLCLFTNNCSLMTTVCLFTEYCLALFFVSKTFVLFIQQQRGDNDEDLVSRIHISSKDYHNKSGFQSRYNKLQRWTTPEVTQLSSMSANYVEFIRHKLNIFAQKQEEFSQRKVTRLKLQKYICVKAMCVQMAKYITDEQNTSPENVLIVIGTTKVSGNDPIRGMIKIDLEN